MPEEASEERPGEIRSELSEKAPVQAEDHIGLARHVVNRTFYRPTEDDDATALLALVEAAAQWNAGKRPCSWSTFAAHKIRWRLIYRFQLASADVISAEVPLSLLAKNEDDEIERPDMAREDPELEAVAVRADVARLLATLAPQEALALRRRFGLDGEPAGPDQIGRELGVGRSRVVQIQQKALGRLRRAVRRSPSRATLSP